MAEDGTEPGIIAAQGRRETSKTGEDGGRVVPNLAS